MSDWEDGFAAGFHKAHGTPKSSSRGVPSKPRSTPKKKAKKMSKDGYHAKYGRAFKRLAPKNKKKDGAWKKDGFKRTAAAARRVAKK
ncbi:MAG TPA: hypothetical protein EYN66_14800 [Myxococcales bacterium]|nr:hypothetical protein [Myxococcales bacterium]